MSILPERFLDNIRDVQGLELDRFSTAHEQPPVISVRKHPVKKSEAFDNNEQVPWCNAGRYLEKRPVFTLDPLLHAGAYYVQEASSMFLDHVLKVLLPTRSNLRVLDLCAAPGGKSTLIASLLEKDSLLVSNEVIKTRVSVLEENVTRWGYMNTWVTNNDAKQLGKLNGYFDVIVVDAPCSGSGLFRKDKEAVTEWSIANVELCSQRQKRILADIWPALKTGGLLVYSTCSYSAEENEMILDWLFEHFPVESKTVRLIKEWHIEETASLKHNMKGYRFYPDKLKGEGFFIAAIEKKDGQEEIRIPKYRSTHNKSTYEMSRHLLNNDNWLCIPTAKKEFSAISQVHEVDFAVLSQFAFLKKTGVKLGAPAGKDWIPAHDIAMSIDCSNTLPIINVDREEALLFLKKDEISSQNIEKGWYIIQYNSLGLGWVKFLGNRFNNYLPKNLRIRMEINDPS